MQEEIIAKFSWVGSKLGIVNKDDEEEEEDEGDEQKEEDKNDKNVKENANHKNENEPKKSKVEMNEKIMNSLPTQRTLYVEDKQNQIVKSSTFQRGSPH